MIAWDFEILSIEIVNCVCYPFIFSHIFYIFLYFFIFFIFFRIFSYFFRIFSYFSVFFHIFCIFSYFSYFFIFFIKNTGVYGYFFESTTPRLLAETVLRSLGCSFPTLYIPLGKCLREITSCGPVTGHVSEVNSSRDRYRRMLSSRPLNERLRSVESLRTFVLSKQQQELFSGIRGEMCITPLYVKHMTPSAKRDTCFRPKALLMSF